MSDRPFIKICSRDHSNHRELFDGTLRLLVNLTNPELLLFKVLFASKLGIVRIFLLSYEELPEDKVTRNYFLQIQAKKKRLQSSLH